MELLERFSSLPFGSDGTMKSSAAATRILRILLPEFPLGTLGGIDLFEREIAPIDLQIITHDRFDISQPHGASINIGAGVIIVNIDCDGCIHAGSPFGFKLADTSLFFACFAIRSGVPGFLDPGLELSERAIILDDHVDARIVEGEISAKR